MTRFFGCVVSNAGDTCGLGLVRVHTKFGKWYINQTSYAEALGDRDVCFHSHPKIKIHLHRSGELRAHSICDVNISLANNRPGTCRHFWPLPRRMYASVSHLAGLYWSNIADFEWPRLANSSPYCMVHTYPKFPYTFKKYTKFKKFGQKCLQIQVSVFCQTWLNGELWVENFDQCSQFRSLIRI